MVECHAEVVTRERVRRFHEQFPEGSIRTFLVKLDEREAVFEARAFRTAEEAAMGIYTSGWAHAAVTERGALEGCESAAIGRALANLGFVARTERPGGARATLPASASAARDEQQQEEDQPELARAA